MTEEWQEIPAFPGYSVSTTGLVRNDKTERNVARCVNQRGIVYVGLCRDGRQYKRSLPVLVLEAFSLRPSFKFDTPINLDGNRSNNDISNLMWRPRWFALKYATQFLYNSVGRISDPVEIVETKEVFENSWHASTTLGVLDHEIAISVMTKNWVYPLRQHFRRLV